MEGPLSGVQRFSAWHSTAGTSPICSASARGTLRQDLSRFAGQIDGRTTEKKRLIISYMMSLLLIAWKACERVKSDRFLITYSGETANIFLPGQRMHVHRHRQIYMHEIIMQKPRAAALDIFKTVT